MGVKGVGVGVYDNGFVLLPLPPFSRYMRVLIKALQVRYSQPVLRMDCFETGAVA